MSDLSVETYQGWHVRLCQTETQKQHLVIEICLQNTSSVYPSPLHLFPLLQLDCS